MDVMDVGAARSFFAGATIHAPRPTLMHRKIYISEKLGIIHYV